MRWLLLIPIMLLFLSNVPVTMEMKMAAEPAEAAAQSGSCSKGESVKTTCHKPGKDACPSNAPKGNTTCHPPANATCICTCLFQYAAPTPVLIPFQFAAHDATGNKTGFLSLPYQAPYLAVPWQPPDMI